MARKKKYKKRELPLIRCMRCGRRARSCCFSKDICQICYKKEPKSRCGGCGVERRFVGDGGGLCLDCLNKAALQAEVDCARCGKRRPPSKIGGDYCRSCVRVVSNGVGICSSCGKKRSYELKRARLCGPCNRNRRAPEGLRRLLSRIQISDEYNRSLFQSLTEFIDWERVDRETLHRFREFGRFLQNYKFEGKLTWEYIIKLKASLPGMKNARIRTCLNRLGELLLHPAEDETPEEVKLRTRPLANVSKVTGEHACVFGRYDLWLRVERKNTLKTRLNHFETLSSFWPWCEALGVSSLADVKPEHVEEYLHTLAFKWRCPRCSFAQNVKRRGEDPPAVCGCCDALHSFEKVIRCVVSTVRGHRARLRVFFGWLQDVEGAITVNPAPAPPRRGRWENSEGGRRARTDFPTVQHYDWETIIALLLDAVQDPQAPPEEAMALYLVLYHGFFLWELQTARIPAECRPATLGGVPPKSFEDELTLEWLEREITRGRQSPGRTREPLKLEAADEPWLPDLAKRFMAERSRKLRDHSNPYLFVGEGRSPSGGRVGGEFFRLRIRNITARVTGRACTINVLGKCSRLIYTEFGGLADGVRHLREMGLSEQQARVYSWARRVKVIPRPQAVRRRGPPKSRRANRDAPLATAGESHD